MTPCEREALALIAEGGCCRAIARELMASEAAIGKHVSGILSKLDLPPAGETHRKVLTVLTRLRA